MDFDANRTLVKIIEERAFGGTYFRDIYSDINGKWHRKSWKQFNELNNIDQNVNVNKYVVKCSTSLKV